ncbi:hypothetical protein Q1695_010021 [Nippostrongylus brasiliensis]|nr:hypothetical protein Q1695_010021 [Nippostrongylus brasiliensis]
MDERRPAASPEDGDSSGFLGLAPTVCSIFCEITEECISVDFDEDFLLNDLSLKYESAMEKIERQRDYEKDSCFLRRTKKMQQRKRRRMRAMVAGVRLKKHRRLTKAICFEDCSMDLHSECLTKLLRRRNIGSIDELKIATALKFKIDLRCFNPQCPAPLLVIAEHYLNCVDDCVHSAPVYSLFDFATAAGELSSDKAEPKKRFDEKNESRRAREAVETSSKKTSEVSTTSKTASDPRDNLNGYGKGKKQDHLEAPEGAVQVKESEPTMYTVVNFPELPKALPVESPSGVSSEGPDELFGVLKQPEQKCDRFDITGMMLASKLRTLHDINRSRCEKWMVRLDEIMSTIGRAIYEETSLSESFGLELT